MFTMLDEIYRTEISVMYELVHIGHGMLYEMSKFSHFDLNVTSDG
jgi:hypothetical protein